MIEGEPDDSPEYFAAKAEWEAYWRRVNQGLESGIDDDPDVVVARIGRHFGPSTAVAAVDRYIENLPSNFELHWRERRRARIHEEEKAERQARNRYGAGRKPKRSDIALLTAWLLVQKRMKSDGLSAVRACKILTEPPSRREASSWPGLLLEYAPGSRSYYVKTPETLRDIYNEGVARYQTGPENLRHLWRSLLEGFTR